MVILNLKNIAIKIIQKRPTKPIYQGECRKCGCLFEFEHSDANDYYIRPLHYYGIEDLENLRDCLGVKDGENEDINGTIIDDSLLGLEVIGNIYDNPELLEGE